MIKFSNPETIKLLNLAVVNILLLDCISGGVEVLYMYDIL